MREIPHSLRAGRRGARPPRFVRGGRLVMASLIVVAAALGVAIVTHLTPGEGWSQGTANGLSVAAGGLLVVVVAYLLLPSVERVLRITTRTRLLELSSPSHPLMRELMARAPGTYSHSMVAANLAETAAGAIGADPLLTRVGAYYHDVGKMQRPVFFVENQANQTNPHDSETPVRSARIITAHVGEGADLAADHHLPRSVVDIIRQHHGDSVVACFYDKASAEANGGSVREADFRYRGERPRTREAALVMIADSAEAAVRTVRGGPVSRVEALLRRIVDQKIADGQLAESHLSESDIDAIVRVYSKMLSSIYHERMVYPDAMPGRSRAGQYHQSPRA